MKKEEQPLVKHLSPEAIGDNTFPLIYHVVKPTSCQDMEDADNIYSSKKKNIISTYYKTQKLVCFNYYKPISKCY